jgi:hypothetical protein
MKSHTSFAIAMVSVAVGCVTVAANSGSANIMYSPVDNSLGTSFMKVEEYQQVYLAGRGSFYQGKYVEALQHLRKADEIIRAQADWTESR